MPYSRVIIPLLIVLLIGGGYILFRFNRTLDKQTEFFGLSTHSTTERESTRSKAFVQFPDGFIIDVELAETSEERTRGLSGHEPLADNEGMLFLFSEHKRYSFWMREMLFPIDIIWINQETVVDITHEAPVPKLVPLPTYRPSEPVNRVLEVNAGIAKEHGLEIGDKLKITFPLP